MHTHPGLAHLVFVSCLFLSKGFLFLEKIPPSRRGSRPWPKLVFLNHLEATSTVNCWWSDGERRFEEGGGGGGGEVQRTRQALLFQPEKTFCCADDAVHLGAYYSISFPISQIYYAQIYGAAAGGKPFFLIESRRTNIFFVLYKFCFYATWCCCWTAEKKNKQLLCWNKLPSSVLSPLPLCTAVLPDFAACAKMALFQLTFTFLSVSKVFPLGAKESSKGCLF